MTDFSHIKDGKVNMVDISGKNTTYRVAVAKGSILINRETLKLINSESLTKGNVYETARISGIMAAKKTAELIPLCHPITINKVDIIFWNEVGEDFSTIFTEAIVKTDSKTGVEMEALTAVSVTLLTIYDMIKAVEKKAEISNIKLIYKEGGKSGKFQTENPKILNKNFKETI